MCVILILGIYNHISVLKENVTDSIISSKDTVISKETLDSLISEGKIGVTASST